jgi:hypothetical protein
VSDGADSPDRSTGPSVALNACISGNNILFRVFFATVIDAERAAGAF